MREGGTKPYGCVYLITNTVNDKKYVGQTITAIKRRWNSHLCDANTRYRGNPLQKAIRKYGPEAFTITVLGVAFAQEQLDALERDAIELHHANVRHHGYNIRAGG